ncbi:hypothetical protein [Coleofasciculus sp. G2-EDA-02]|uniref:hypothetical protein n=1 Tax=Coleofasciculus sp. G2-EDA-02 TaxID=3069529 RepID=UPI0032F2CB70
MTGEGIVANNSEIAQAVPMRVSGKTIQILLAIIATILAILQGRTLKLSPFVALLSIVFWGWVWGIPSALLGIPMTMSVIVLSQEFESTRAIALLFGDTDDPELKEN